jgi:hypothetical protein
MERNYEHTIPMSIQFPTLPSIRCLPPVAGPTVRDVDHFEALLTPYPGDEMTAYPVSPRVNDSA